jgi:hypothetical protein
MDVRVTEFYPYGNYKHDHKIHDIDINLTLRKFGINIRIIITKCITDISPKTSLFKKWLIVKKYILHMSMRNVAGYVTGYWLACAHELGMQGDGLYHLWYYHPTVECVIVLSLLKKPLYLLLFLMDKKTLF